MLNPMDETADEPTNETMDDPTDNCLDARYAARIAARPNEESGFYPLVDGIAALAGRLTLAARAQKTLDTQYYLIKGDATSNAFIKALLEAADRGVRVRFLLDDVFTSGLDARLAALDSHPNFAVRIFNPFSRGILGRGWSVITRPRRVNRRMHTKSFTVDKQVTILGGRNIADEYFGAHEDEKFDDLDVLGVGSVVAGVSGMFDRFWDHPAALPLSAFARIADDPAAGLKRLRQELGELRGRVKGTQYSETIVGTARGFLQDVDANLDWAPYTLVYDSPDKVVEPKSGPSMSIAQSLGKTVRSATERLIILSPYFVPRRDGIELLSSLKARGVEVIVITNSLAANNHVAVHGGYVPSRKPLLRNGVRIYEARPDAEVPGAEIFAASGAKATLHTKAFLVDRREVFIGSFNFDPRSINLNTESGVLIRSKKLAERFEAEVDAALDKHTYELFLDERGRLRWRGFENDGREVIFKKEPQAGLGRRLVAILMRMMPVRSQL